jgi:hypothetical protein
VPAQTTKRRHGLKAKSPRPGVPLPGLGGYDYPRGPFGATGFPGSTPAAAPTHTQTSGGRRDRQLTATGNQAEWASLPPRRPGGDPEQPYARSLRTARAEHRMTPIIGGAPGAENVRNQIAQRYKAVPGLVRGYRAAPNPGKTGAHQQGTSQFHPGQAVWGDPDGKPIPGMASQPGAPPEVDVPSRYVSLEGSMEGYAMNRALLFSKGGTPPPYPSSYTRFTGNQHLRGGRLTGQRYFGDLADQQRVGLPTDAYGIARARGPRHRPVSFAQPGPWTANYYDVAPGASGDQAPDMIHASPSRPRAGRAVRRG